MPIFCHTPFVLSSSLVLFFFFNDPATTEIYTLSLHDALPIFSAQTRDGLAGDMARPMLPHNPAGKPGLCVISVQCSDRKSTRLNSSHVEISYAVFCLKKKKKYIQYDQQLWRQHYISCVMLVHT